MRIALINSGLGLLAAAAELHRLRPEADLVLAMDPDGMPWGPRTPDDIAARSLACARAAAAYLPDVLVFACNSGSVHALPALRAEFEPGVPVVGTVPAIKPAAAHSQMVAIWATVATTGSAYQRQLISEFAASAQVTPVACPGLADAVDAGDADATQAAIAAAAARTPPGCGAVVLGCTEYELAAEQIAAALPGAVLFGSAAAVAAQALRRVAATATPAHPPAGQAPPPGQAPLGQAPLGQAPPLGQGPDPLQAHRSGPVPDPGQTLRPGQGRVHVLLSGRPADLPPAALRYPAGRALAALAGDHAAGSAASAPAMLRHPARS
jgi:glutamate racemase